MLLRRPDNLPVAYCGVCSLWYVTSAPKPDKLDQFYQKYWDVSRPSPA